MTAIRRLAGAAVLLTFVQILLGAVVRLTGSGLACPDWPLCYGLWFPTPGKLAGLVEVDYGFAQVMLEWGHRFNAAGLVAPLTLVLAVLAWRLRRRAPALWRLIAAAVIVLAVQAGLGGLTVLDRNSPWTVAVHLSVALVFFGLLLSGHLAARVTAGAAAGTARHDRVAIAALALLALLAAASGAMVAKSAASLACPSWPLCEGRLIPDLADPAVRLNFVHRLLALATVLAVALGALRWRALRPAAAVVLVQALLGGVVVAAFAAGAPAWQVMVGAGHQAIAVVLLGALVWAFWSPEPGPAARGGG